MNKAGVYTRSGVPRDGPVQQQYKTRTKIFVTVTQRLTVRIGGRRARSAAASGADVAAAASGAVVNRYRNGDRMFSAGRPR